MYKNPVRNKHRHADYDLAADLEKIKSALGDTARDVRGKASDMVVQSLENAKETTTEIQTFLTSYIQEKPLKSVSIAMAIGTILGFVLHRNKN